MGWSWHVSRPGSRLRLWKPENIASNYGERGQEAFKRVLSRNRCECERRTFFSSLQPLSSAGGQFVASWLIGTVPAAPVRNGTSYTASPGDSLPSARSMRIITRINYPPSHPAPARVRGGRFLMKFPE